MTMIAPMSVTAPTTAHSGAVMRPVDAMMIAIRAPARVAAAFARVRGAAVQGAFRTVEAPSRAGFPDSKDWEAMT
jgi:hypothetical protein